MVAVEHHEAAAARAPRARKPKHGAERRGIVKRVDSRSPQPLPGKGQVGRAIRRGAPSRPGTGRWNRKRQAKKIQIRAPCLQGAPPGLDPRSDSLPYQSCVALFPRIPGWIPGTPPITRVVSTASYNRPRTSLQVRRSRSVFSISASVSASRLT